MKYLRYTCDIRNRQAQKQRSVLKLKWASALPITPSLEIKMSSMIIQKIYFQPGNRFRIASTRIFFLTFAAGKFFYKKHKIQAIISFLIQNLIKKIKKSVFCTKMSNVILIIYLLLHHPLSINIRFHSAITHLVAIFQKSRILSPKLL